MTFERQSLLERQAEGIALAKKKGKYKDRKPLERAKMEQAYDVLNNGMSKSKV